MKIWEDSNLQICKFNACDAKEYLNDIARLRINIFREYPYLYEGNLESEKKYLCTYFEAKESVIYILFDRGNVVGALTTIPMQFETPELLNAFSFSDIPARDCLYLGDMLLEKEYRGKKLFPIFFDAVKKSGFKHLVLMTIKTSESDIMRPKNFRDIDSLCAKFGFKKIENGELSYTWKSIACGGNDKVHSLQLYIL